jgi:tRNA nucleotidyltransferase/poly(A) polymerase
MATLIISDKICSHCGGNKWIIEYRKRPTKANPDNKTLRYRCSVKSDERSKRWKFNNPDKVKKYVQLPKPDGYWKTPKMKEHYRLKSKRESEQLTDNFVKNKILGKSGSLAREMLSFKDITQELVEIKRKSILLNRQLKNHGNS